MAAAIVAEEGVVGLWRGVGVSMVRSGVGAVALLPTNSKLKKLAARWMPPGALADGLCALGACYQLPTFYYLRFTTYYLWMGSAR